MRSISILDCTLRDGGYINSWRFGKSAISEIVSLLEESGVETIECGFIEDAPQDPDVSVYRNADMIDSFTKKAGTRYVAMIALGDIDAEKVTPRRPEGIDGIRLTFHKHELEEEMRQARILMDKGYDVYVQPVGTSTYTDRELIDLIDRVNALHPYAFYIVDTLGVMYPNDVRRIFSIIDSNLDPETVVGFHSHNNLQLSFSNAQTIMSVSEKRDLIIDSSVFGMGRGAGNLTTELITQYINNTYGHKYNILPLLSVMERYLNDIYLKTPWGYSSPYYLSAVNKCHPNYANYLMLKRTLGAESISKILSLIPPESRGLYDKKLIEHLYYSFQSSKIDDSEAVSEIGRILHGRKILVLASGDSVKTYRKQISDWITANDAFVIHINTVKEGYPANMLFISNALRAESLPADSLNGIKIVATSNFRLKDDSVLRVDYPSLLNESSEPDNAGLMLLSLLVKVGVKHAALAGFDGFGGGSEDYVGFVSRSYMQRDAGEMNDQISHVLQHLSQSMDMEFVTPTMYALQG
ncbi:aldolase catalytic domain-containing protein [Methanomassiliicoccales archaeon LGM-DZ1]|nr:aldolase catalytic domain-containing protein [Methanomassiliicoccales archaeon LGM-DZ1]